MGDGKSFAGVGGYDSCCCGNFFGGALVPVSEKTECSSDGFVEYWAAAFACPVGTDVSLDFINGGFGDEPVPLWSAGGPLNPG